MSNNIHTMREWYQISSVEFGFLFPEQLRKLSVVQIDNPVVYDGEKRPFKKGLYDAALGVSPNDREAVCETCGHMGLECSGHPGHIELVLPTYNPLLMDIMLKLLKVMCLDCHRLRIRPRIKDDYGVVLKLLREDRIKEAYDYHETNIEDEIRKLEKLENEPEAKKNKDQFKEKVMRAKSRIAYVSELRRAAGESKAAKSTGTSVQLFSQFLKMLMGVVQKKCPYANCLKEAKKVKKEGANKIFITTKEEQEGSNKRRKKSRDSQSKNESTQNMVEKRSQSRYMSPKQIYNCLRKLWRNQREILSVMFGNQQRANSFTMFFLNAVFVPPSRFRPESKMGEEKYLHDHTSILCRILQSNADLKQAICDERLDEVVLEEGDRNKKTIKQDLKALSTQALKDTPWYGHIVKKLKGRHQFINKWLELQDSVNCYIDASKSSRMADRESKGIRQILQRKEGLFRMKMMGKRVNHAARSVISPDPSLNSDQVGIPIFMAKKLTFPEHVNQYNLQKLQSYVANGKKYPGANLLEEEGKLIKLDCLSDEQRISHARNLWNNHENKIVYRHMQDGDNVLFNRQPTLHKASLMAHRIKVLPRESTLRMNYANCKSYNADFDGDEMNLHALQNYMAKAEAQLCISDQMYENPTNGKPLREIIQDSIIAAVYLSMRDTFFNKQEYTELLYQATFSLLEGKPANTRLFLLEPAIMKPRVCWTGKQLISNVMKIVVAFSSLSFKEEKGLCMRSTAKVGKNYMQGYEEESEIVVVDNQLLRGLVDKNQIGSNSDYGMLHSFTELYGEKLTGSLITSLNKLFLNYMQVHGFTCGLDDLILKTKANRARTTLLKEVHSYTVEQVCTNYKCPSPIQVDYMGRKPMQCDETGQCIDQQQKCHVDPNQEILKFLQHKICTEKYATDELDAEYKHHLNDKSSKVIDVSLKGFAKRFPWNNFSMMTVTGAKGSNVNHSQVGVMLGQQELQGRRVPIMITGKTLPSFLPYDPNPRAAGFIADRFLTGLREQQFYFHCMAGREGLIDTAVKTSRSGYLQRCLMKHLESLKVQYDNTVRDSDGSIVQFLYGQDCLNPSKDKFFHKLDFIQKNLSVYKQKYKLKDFASMMKTEEICAFKADPHSKETLMEMYPIANNLGSMSENCFRRVKDRSMELKQIYGLKYKFNMVEAGEAVGCTAAQSIGEPSTQMTLNTFHLAGHGGVNLTLGIPRLRELLMTSTDKIKTPIMELYFKEVTNLSKAREYAKCMEKVRLAQLIRSVEVEEWKQLQKQGKLLASQERKRYYRITLHYENEAAMREEFKITYQNIEDKIKNTLVNKLIQKILRVKKKNDLKAEIKRSEKPEREEEDEEEEENEEQEKEKEDPKQLKEQATTAKELDRVVFNQGNCQITVKVPLNLKKLLMTKLTEQLLGIIIMKETTGISSVIILQKKGVPYIQTEGVNFDALKQLDFIDYNRVRSNDIQAIAKKFGVEAARTVLVQEIVSLFGGYSVTVDYRHLYLIGDYVTFGGGIKAMNRNWMNYNASPFLRMTFETSVKFITNAALHCEVDECRTPSSKIILGQCPEVGTGMCDLLMDVTL